MTVLALPAVIDVDVAGVITLGELIVGAAAALLAGFTFLLARSTRQSFATAALAIGAKDMPYLVPEKLPAGTQLRGTTLPPRAYIGLVRTPYGPALAMRLSDIGRGPAIVVDIRLELDGQECLQPITCHRPIHAGGAYDGFYTGFSAPDPGGFNKGTLTVVYSHANGSLWKTVSKVRLSEMQSMVIENYQRQEASQSEVRSPRTSDVSAAQMHGAPLVAALTVVPHQGPTD